MEDDIKAFGTTHDSTDGSLLTFQIGTALWIKAARDKNLPKLSKAVVVVKGAARCMTPPGTKTMRRRQQADNKREREKEKSSATKERTEKGKGDMGS